MRSRLRVEGWFGGAAGACVAIVLAGLAARLVMTLGSRGVLWPDSMQYYRSAADLVGGKELFPHAPYHTPFYILFLAGFLLFGQTPAVGWAIILAQRALGIATAVVFYRVARRVFPRGPALAASLLFSVHSVQLYYETVVQTETLFTFLLGLFLLAALTALERQRPGDYLLIGALCGVLALTRPVAQLYLAPVLLALALAARGWSRKLAACALALFAQLLVLLPWMYINARTLGFWGISRGQGMNLMLRALDLDGLRPARRSRYRSLKQLYLQESRQNPRASYRIFQQLRRIRSLGISGSDRLMMNFALETIKAHPYRYAVNSARYFGSMFWSAHRSVMVCGWPDDPYLCGPTSELEVPAFPRTGPRGALWARQAVASWMRNFSIPMPAVTVLAVIGLLGCFLGGRGCSAAGASLLALTCLYFAAMPAIFNMDQDRYRLPFDPLLFAFAAWGALQGWRQLSGLFRRGRGTS